MVGETLHEVVLVCTRLSGDFVHLWGILYFVCLCLLFCLWNFSHCSTHIEKEYSTAWGFHEIFHICAEKKQQKRNQHAHQSQQVSTLQCRWLAGFVVSGLCEEYTSGGYKIVPSAAGIGAAEILNKMVKKCKVEQKHAYLTDYSHKTNKD